MFVLDTYGTNNPPQTQTSSSCLEPLGAKNADEKTREHFWEEFRKLKIELVQNHGKSLGDLNGFRKALLRATGKTSSPLYRLSGNDQDEELIVEKPLVESNNAQSRKDKRLANDATSSFSELKMNVQKALEKAVVTPEFEQLQSTPRYEVSKRKLQRERREERDKTKGTAWYGLPAAEMTDELKQDLEVLQMRSVLDPKHFYKKNDLKVLPKYFHVGKVIDSPLDFYNNRLTKKERKRTLVDELLADAEFQQYNKRKYREIEEEKQKTHYKSWRKAKSLKKKKK